MKLKPDNRRLGKFISDDMLFPSWEDMLPIMGNFVPIRVEHRWDKCAFEIIAFSPLFDVIPEGIATPEYELEIAYFPNAPAVIKAHRIKT